MIVGLGTNFWNNALYSERNIGLPDSEFIPIGIKIIPVVFSMTGIILGLSFYYILPISLINYKLSYNKLYGFLIKKWYFDKLINEYVIQLVYDISYNITFKKLDRGLLEYLGPHGLSLSILSISKNVSKLQTGILYHYAFIILIGLTLYISLIIFNITYNLNIIKQIIITIIPFILLIL